MSPFAPALCTSQYLLSPRLLPILLGFTNMYLLSPYQVSLFHESFENFFVIEFESIGSEVEF
jgi:hypothetical protein